MTKQALPPLIIIGMHRSGTSMITGMLEEMGLCLGKGKESGNNREHPFFVEINEWLLDQCNGSWRNPEPIAALLGQADLRELVADYLGFYMKTSRAISFLGWGGYLRYGTPARLDMPWGWKDPRNTYTLPIWMDLFPDARVVHIIRHGVDVANSMKVRTDKGMKRAMEELPARSKTKYRTLYHRWLEPKLWGFANALQDGSLESGLDLWERYVTEAHGHVRRLGSGALEFRYEDFLLDPGPVLKQLAAFAKLEPGDATVARLAERVRKDRAFAYRKHPHLMAFAEDRGDRLKVWGY
ncbi:MAG: sulfotransferase [Syntrophobacteraceae bacterium]